MTLPLTRASRRRAATRIPLIREWLRWTPTATVVLALTSVLLVLGARPDDLLGYTARLAVCVLVPGLVILRLVSGTARSLLDDATIGFSIGTVAQLPVWWLCLGTGLSIWWWPILVVAVVLAVRPARRRVLRASPARTPPCWAWATAGVCLVALTWVTGDYLRWNPPDPGSGHVYYPDMPYHLGLAAEASRRLPPTDPFVAGEPLHYHWLAHLDMAVASRAAGVELAVVLYQLWVPVIVLAGVCTVAVVGTRISGHLWAGPLAALLVFGVGQISARSWTANQFRPMTLFYYWASPTQTLATVLTVTTAAFVCGYLGATTPRCAAQFWLLGLPLMASLTLVKASALPLLVAGAAAAWAVSALRQNRLSRRRAATAFLVGVGWLWTATQVLYGGDSQGLRYESPFNTFVTMTEAVVDAVAAPEVPLWAVGVAVGVVAATWTISVLGRLLGVILLLPRWRTLTTAQVFLLGALLAGIAAFATLSHPGGSQMYFLIGAFPLGAILSAWSICAVGPSLDRRTLVALVCTIVAAAALILMSRGLLGGTPDGGARIREQLLWLIRPYAILIIGVLAVLIALRQRDQHRGGVNGLRAQHLLVAAVIAGGLPMTFSYVISDPLTTGASKARALLDDNAWAAVTGHGVEAARWLRDHSEPDDVVATNRHCAMPEPVAGSATVDCRAMGFWVTAYTERRSFVEGWAFSHRARPRDVAAQTAPGVQPFWDPARLAANDRLFERPDSRTAKRLCDLGVDWAFLDRRWDPEAPSLAHVATMRHRTPHAEVYRLPCEQAR